MDNKVSSSRNDIVCDSRKKSKLIYIRGEISMAVSNTYSAHIAFLKQKEVAAICQILFQESPVTFFSYQRHYADGFYTCLASQSELVDYLLTDNVYQYDWYFSSSYNAIRSGYLIWDIARNFHHHQEQNEISKVIHKEFGLAHGIDLLEKTENYIDCFTFASNHINIYQCTMNYLKQFIFYFKQEARGLINQSWKERFFLITLPPSLNLPILDTENTIEPRSSYSFQLKRYYLNNGSTEVYLTNKEYACLRELSQGLTTKETARILKVSSRTIEQHTATLKEKLGCSHITEAIHIAKKHHLI